MAKYQALGMLFIVDRLILAGEQFESDLPPGRNWHPLDAEAKAKVAEKNFQPLPKPPGQHDTERVEIPSNWKDLHPSAVLGLARKLGMGVGGKLADAKAKIESEIAARAVTG